jgi:hypothetical protein
MQVYIVKSFGSDGGYLNLKVFTTEDEAEGFAKIVARQIPIESIESGDEFVEVEEMTLEGKI